MPIYELRIHYIYLSIRNSHHSHKICRFASYFMDSRELEALKEIWRRGGKASISSLARAMGINSDYARVVLLDIGKKDYIDITRDGMCKIAEKGKELLKSRGILDKIAEEEKARKEVERAKIKHEEEKGKPKIITLNY